MDTYEFRIERRKPTPKQRAVASFVTGCIYFAVSVALSRTPALRSQGFGWLAIESVIFGLIFGVVIFVPNNATNGTILVSEDRMTELIEASWFRRTYRRSVRRGRIRSIVVMKPRLGRPGGIGISEKSKFAARMSGFVFLPDTLPEFNELKSLAESWRGHDRDDSAE